MASDSDDNPFARNSVWPRMPQTPLRIRTLTGSEGQEPEPPPVTFTPLFVRPMDAPQTEQPSTGGGVPRSVAAPSPVATPANASALQPDSLAHDGPESAQAADVRPQTRRQKPGHSRLPAIVATLVGVAGLIGLAWLLNRGWEVPLTASPAVPTASSDVVPVPTPVSQVSAATPPTSARIVAPVVPGPLPRAIAAAAKPVRARRQVAVGTPEPEASIATSEVLSETALVLPATAPAPINRPPPVTDPTAPVVTRDPNS